MKQANTEGTDYGDGFNASHFVGLTLSELGQAMLILEKRALSGDTVAINAVKFLGNDNAISILSLVLEKVDIIAMRSINQAAIEMYEITKNQEFLKRILDNLPKCSKQEKFHGVQLLCSVEYGDMFDIVKHTLNELVLTDNDEVIRHSAAKKILLESGIQRNTQLYKDLIGKLTNNDRQIRLNALDSLMELSGTGTLRKN
ncbi:hypothetical protein [Vibrio cholerae]|uniref:hypothetical protein n=1 Tax=Vibrio cholerae TaxID=666 RepID=UPI001E6267A3|nr:hypothetical protein [Vibrio cholerae]EJL8268208.1 hypothetical protein [Vibrio cholerae]ELJ8608783.1 hypothetical protein [Vibrio cholerae]MCD6730501.1 hypothetical protein [Vibrio cholerae]HDI3167603.1 hypothetical protein [Vibrio cholerae]